MIRGEFRDHFFLYLRNVGKHWNIETPNKKWGQSGKYDQTRSAASNNTGAHGATNFRKGHKGTFGTKWNRNSRYGKWNSRGVNCTEAMNGPDRNTNSCGAMDYRDDNGDQACVNMDGQESSSDVEFPEVDSY